MHVEFYKDEHFEQAVNIFTELGAYYLGQARSSTKHIKENLKNNILGTDSGVKLILAIDQNKNAVGLATISLLYPAPNETCQLFIKELFVSEAHQKKGIGKSILGFIARYAQSKNCSRVDLTVDTDNINAIEFYKKMGIANLSNKIYLRAENEAISKIANHM